jgi:hypothetical protein
MRIRISRRSLDQICAAVGRQVRFAARRALTLRNVLARRFDTKSVLAYHLVPAPTPMINTAFVSQVSP